MAKDTKESTGTPTWDPSNVKVTRSLNNSFRMEKDKPYHVQLLSLLYVDESRGNQDEETGAKKGKGKRQYAPPTMVRALDLTDGREIDMILNAVPLKRLEDSYPNGEHLGCCFRIVKSAPRVGKNYAEFAIDEIDGSGSPHYRKPEVVKKEASKYGPRKTK